VHSNAVSYLRLVVKWVQSNAVSYFAFGGDMGA
jgi:hypothetical protein